MLQHFPVLSRSLTLSFVGDWGQANFHRICSWLAQEVCDRAGPRSRVAIWNLRDGGIEGIYAVQDGEAQLAIATPAMILPTAISGEGLFAGRACPDLRALAVLPQNDRLVLALLPRFGISSFAELREKRPPLKIATSSNDGTNLIGYVARRYMEAHGIDEATLESWGGCYVSTTRPEQSLAIMRDGGAGAVLQEATMTPLWAEVMQKQNLIALSGEHAALERLATDFAFRRNHLPAGYWPSLGSATDTLDFSDFVVLVRSDMMEDLAYLLAWCLVETREAIERQYRHLAPERSPLTYPLDPKKMAASPIPLHPGARKYYVTAGHC